MLSSERCPGCEHKNADREGMCIRLWSFFARRQKLGLWLERESGMTITAHLAYARFTQAGKRSIAPWQNRWRTKASRGKSEEGTPINRVFPHLPHNHSHRIGIIRARLR